MLAALVILCLATGLAGLLDVTDRRAVLAGVTERSSPLAGATVEIYQSLSDADATATGAFLAGESASREWRDRYEANIKEAADALSTAAAGASDVPTATAVAELTTQLPVYTGLIDTAGTYNRLGSAMGAAYLREASAFARDRMLPTARRLYQDEMVRLAAAQADAGSVPWFAISLGVLTLGGLVGVQIYLRRTTHRMLNGGLLAASGAVLVALGWLVIASADAARHSEAGRRDGSAQLEALTEARIAALTARSEEALMVVARGSGQTNEHRFQQARSTLNGGDTQLGSMATALSRVSQPDTHSTVDSAVITWRMWYVLHKQLSTYVADSKHNQAVKLATGVDPDPESAQPAPAEPGDLSTGQLSTRLDGQLSAAASQAQVRLSEHAVQAGTAVAGTDIGVAVLTLLAAASVALGMAPRIREYR
jgi:hypothetical protein